MSYISLHFACMVLGIFFLYYILPKRFQPYLLLLGSLYFYYRCSGKLILILLITSLFTYLMGLLLQSHKIKYLFVCSCLLLLLPLATIRYYPVSIAIPVGISYYTLQLIAYCSDVYHGRTTAEKNPLYFILFATFFPQILQGPIPRFAELKKTLLVEHEYDRHLVESGFSYILIGLVLKYLIANKAAVLVDYVFNSNETMPGSAFLIAGIIYSFQLLADFMSCVRISQGVSFLFGIKLSENFMQPYCATSIKDFWHRWHISLSSWLRDYIYIPLGGSRKGKLRTDINILIVFLASGLWHGKGLKYILWGLMHGVYQLIGKYTFSLRNRFFSRLHCPNGLRRVIQIVSTYILVMLAWIVFRANSLPKAVDALTALITRFDFSFITEGTILDSGLDLPEIILLIALIIIFMLCEFRQNTGHNLNLILVGKNGIFQIAISLLILSIIAVFGTYGIGFDANAFIYGGF